jgi:xanthine dehydrogenase YagT iron-sulfur-binding subunit
MSGNLCRCGAYAGITDAVLDSLGRMRETTQNGEAA